jgi:hypothetical protein
MKLFLSWSGPRSKAVAESLRDWLPNVIQALQPWMSASDIDKGIRWGPEIAAQLQEAKVGIVCLTADNLNAPWLLFETGALSKTLEKTFVCPYLLDIEPTDLTGPFAQFTATKAQKDDTKKLLGTINKAMGDQALDEKLLDKQFEKWWPDLDERLGNIPDSVEESQPKRGEREMLEELLLLVRALKEGLEEMPRRINFLQRTLDRIAREARQEMLREELDLDRSGGQLELLPKDPREEARWAEVVKLVEKLGKRTLQ